MTIAPRYPPTEKPVPHPLMRCRLFLHVPPGVRTRSAIALPDFGDTYNIAHTLRTMLHKVWKYARKIVEKFEIHGIIEDELQHPWRP